MNFRMVRLFCNAVTYNYFEDYPFMKIRFSNEILTKAVAGKYSIKRFSLKILQNSQGHTCVIVFFNNIAGKGQQLY